MSTTQTTADTHDKTAEFAEFYRATFHNVAAQLYAYLGDHAEAQDLTQEAFCRALDRWSRLSGYENPGGWVRQVAWNLATSRLRHLQVVHRFLAARRQEDVQPPSPDRVDLTRALSGLPPNHRLAVVLHHVGRLSTSEIAEQCGVAEGTVRSWLSRGRTQLAEQLVDWDQASAVTAAPPEGGIDAAVARVRRRRTARRATLAAVLALLVAVPLAVLVMAQPSEPPVIGPTPPPASPSPTRAPSAVDTLRIVLPEEFRASLGDVVWIDRDHAWLSQNPCQLDAVNPTCMKIATTADGGRTWRKVTMPQVPDGARAVLFAIDANTATLQVTQARQDRPSNYLHTNDGGASFTSYPVEGPPAETLIGMLGHYQMLCPGATGLEDGAWGISCDRVQLVKVGSGRMATQPPVRVPSATITEGADGRLWLVTGAEKERLLVSDDSAKTWKELPWPSGVHGYLALSPDGGQAWIADRLAPEGIALWQLTGSHWVKRYTVDKQTEPILLDADVWLVGNRGASAYLHDGQFTAIPDLPMATGGYRLRDGTILLSASDSTKFFGVGSGTQYRWARISL